MTKPIQIHVIMGKTLSGKSTIMPQLEELGIKRLLTTTTRPIRETEQPNTEYYFVSKYQYNYDIDNNNAIAPRTYHVANGDYWHYYLNKKTLLETTTPSNVLILDEAGYMELHDTLKYSDDPVLRQIDIHGWYLDIDLKTRLRRYVDGNRQNEDPKEVLRRLYDDEFNAFQDLDQIRDNPDFAEEYNIHVAHDSMSLIGQIGMCTAAYLHNSNSDNSWYTSHRPNY